jgi:hypothetical protein
MTRQTMSRDRAKKIFDLRMETVSFCMEFVAAFAAALLVGGGIAHNLVSERAGDIVVQATLIPLSVALLAAFVCIMRARPYAKPADGVAAHRR